MNVVFEIAKLTNILANCRFIEKKEDVPSFLLEDGAVHFDGDSIVMYCVDGTDPAVRELPVFLKWEQASKEKKSTLIHVVDGHVVHPSFATWPKDDGFETLNHDSEGNCFQKGIKLLRAAMVSEELPPLDFGDQKVEKVGNSWMIITSWGEKRYGECGRAVFVEYGPENINIVALTEPSAREYTVFEGGKMKGNMVDFLS